MAQLLKQFFANPVCPNINCMNGIIIFDGGSERKCSKCAKYSVKFNKKIPHRAGSYVFVTDVKNCEKSFSHYPATRIFKVTSMNHNYTWLNSMSMGLPHGQVVLATRAQIKDHFEKYDDNGVRKYNILDPKTLNTMFDKLKEYGSKRRK